MDELIAWLRQQVDEDERAIWAPLQVSQWVADARQVYTVDPEGWEVVNETSTRGVAEHIAHFDPRNQLDNVGAKRAIFDHAEQWAQTLHNLPDGWTEAGATAYRMAMEWTLRAQALAYASRPGYRSEWAP